MKKATALVMDWTIAAHLLFLLGGGTAVMILQSIRPTLRWLPFSGQLIFAAQAMCWVFIVAVMGSLGQRCLVIPLAMAAVYSLGMSVDAYWQVATSAKTSLLPFIGRDFDISPLFSVDGFWGPLWSNPGFWFNLAFCCTIQLLQAGIGVRVQNLSGVARTAVKYIAWASYVIDLIVGLSAFPALSANLITLASAVIQMAIQVFAFEFIMVALFSGIEATGDYLSLLLSKVKKPPINVQATPSGGSQGRSTSPAGAAGYTP